jgi:hypothetical protein
MARGMWESLFGLIFCWLPGVGLILSVVGFCRQMVRLTEIHKARKALYTLLSGAVLVVCIGALVGEAYLYSRDQDVAGKAGLWLWQKVTGQETLPGMDPYADPYAGLMDGQDYMPDEYYTGDGGQDYVPDEYYTGDDGQDYVPDEYNTGDGGQVEEGDLSPDGLPGGIGDALPNRDNDGGDEEGDYQDGMDFYEDDTDEGGAGMPSLKDLLESSGVAVG